MKTEELTVGKYYFVTKHRDSSWIVKIRAIQKDSVYVDTISPGKKSFMKDWILSSKNRVFIEADSEQIRHYDICNQLGIYRSKPNIKSLSNFLNNYDIC